MMADLEYRIAKLEAKPADVLVLKIDARLTLEMHQRIRDCFTGKGITNKVLIIEKGCDLSVLTREDIDNLTGSTA